jgi:hypothetical protein
MFVDGHKYLANIHHIHHENTYWFIMLISEYRLTRYTSVLILTAILSTEAKERGYFMVNVMRQKLLSDLCKRSFKLIMLHRTI